MSEVEIKLGRIEGKIDSLIEIRKDHELRIRALEILILETKGGWKMILLVLAAFGSILYFSLDQALKFFHK